MSERDWDEPSLHLEGSADQRSGKFSSTIVMQRFLCFHGLTSQPIYPTEDIHIWTPFCNFKRTHFN